MHSHQIVLASEAGIGAPDLARLAAVSQQEPRTHIGYFGCNECSIAEEIGEVAGWPGTTAVALGPDGLRGWLLAETDDEIGRIWWWGPVIDVQAPWDELADALYRVARGALPASLREEELAGDDRHDRLRHFAEQQGFVAQEASVALDWHAPSTPLEPSGAVRPFRPSDAAEVAALHDALFPGTHTTGLQLTVADRAGIRLVTESESLITGYLIAEIQPGALGYVDYVGVESEHRGRGLGRALVHAALVELTGRGVTAAHLTVRESNVAARRVYRSLGFREECLLRPYRKGFLLDS